MFYFFFLLLGKFDCLYYVRLEFLGDKLVKNLLDF